MAVLINFTILAAIFFVGTSCDNKVKFLNSALSDQSINYTFGTDPTCPSTGTSYYPNYGDCHRYFECSDGELLPLQCPTGMAWSTVLNACGVESTVDCSYVTPSNDEDCPSNGISYLPDYADCTKYYLCKMGVKTLLDCPAGEAWSLIISACDIIANVDCSYTTLEPNTSTTTTTTTTTITTTTPSPRPDNDCPYPSSNVTFLPDYYDCSRFYECINGEKKSMACPQDYLWNITVNKCEFKDFVDCSFTSTYPTETAPTTTTPKPVTTSTTPRPVISSTTPRPVTISTSSSARPTYTTPPSNICWTHSDGDTFKDPSDCTKYYECIHGDLIVRECAAGTSYDVYTGACDDNFATNCP